MDAPGDPHPLQSAKALWKTPPYVPYCAMWMSVPYQAGGHVMAL